MLHYSEFMSTALYCGELGEYHALRGQVEVYRLQSLQTSVAVLSILK